LAVTDLRKDAAHRYSPAAVVAVEREAVAGVPVQISTSYVERSNLSIRMASRRFTRLTNGFSKTIEHHAAAVSLYMAHYNLSRVHEAVANRATPAMVIGLTDHAWSIGEPIDAALSAVPPKPTPTAPEDCQVACAHTGEADGISATPSAIDRATTIYCCASAHCNTARGDPNGGGSRNKPDAGSHDAICRIVNVLAVDDGVRRVCYRARDREC